MKLAVIIAIGGGMGALGRYFLVGYITQLFGGGFPWGILAVNVVGSMILGVVVEFGAQTPLLTAEFKALLAVGFLGAFTTFSTFSLDIVELCQKGLWGLAGMYISASVVVAVIGLVAGIVITRGIMT
jgi:CrcB protein